MMKSRESGNRYKGYWASAPEASACVDAEKPFEITNINVECIKEQKHGHWEISFDGYYPYCSECGYRPTGVKLMDVCPECGARMESDKDA